MKLLKRLTIKNLLMNKSRTIVTIIGIMLSVALITTVAGIVTSLDASTLESMIQSSGDYDFLITGEFTEENIADIRANRNIKDVYYAENLTAVKIEQPKHIYKTMYFICNTNTATLNASRCKLESGRFAENENEVVLSPSLLHYSGVEYKVGDTLKCSTGTRRWKQDSEVGRMYYKSIGSYDIPPSVPFYFGDDEEWVSTGEREYTIVGILKSENGFANTSYSEYAVSGMSEIKVYTCGKPEKYNALYIDIKDEAEKNYTAVIAQILGINASDADSILRRINAAYYGSEETASYDNELSMNVYTISPNAPYLNQKGIVIDNYNTYGFSFSSGWIMVVGMLVVMLASVFIIRNSFAISINEKTRLYGMLASVGATPRQIRRNVYFEAFILGLFGIPLGLLLGIGATAGLIQLSNLILGSQTYFSSELMFALPVHAVFIAVGVGIVTILLSASSSAVRASRTSPMEAIRSNNSINITKKQLRKGYPTPKWVSKIFGVGGSIAWKNMKRSRRQYRTIVVSIVVSVVLYLTVTSVVDYVMCQLMSQDFYKIATSEYNMTVYVYPEYNEKDQDTNGIVFKTDSVVKYLDGLASELGLDQYRYQYYSVSYDFAINDYDLCDDVSAGGVYHDRLNTAMVSGKKLTCPLMAVDRQTFMELCDEAGLKYEDCKDKGLIWNYAIISTDEKGDRMLRPEKVQFLKEPVGMVLEGEYVDEDYIYEEDENGDYNYDSEPQVVREVYKTEIEIAGTFETAPTNNVFRGMEENFCIVVTPERFAKAESTIGMAFLDAGISDPDAFEDRVDDAHYDGKYENLSVMNYSKTVNSTKSYITIIQIFVYGFIAVISLIGVTNLFNTVTTNMKLRQKEFAMLRSIGTTNKELHRMILLESVLFTAKALIIGIPIGLLIGFGLCWVLSGSMGGYGSMGIYYQMPWIPILVSLLCVLTLLFVIMRFSISKFNRQNIIETIRNDNI